MSSIVIDHQSLGRSRIATQYTESQKFLAYIRALLDSSAELEAVLQKVAEQSDIDIAEGVNLDVIGEIVGVSRIIPDSIAVKFFGFEGQPGGDVFGEEGALGIGSRFRDELEPETATSVLADPEYRLLIRAKIVKNHAKGTNEDILQGLAYLFNAPLIACNDPYLGDGLDLQGEPFLIGQRLHAGGDLLNCCPYIARLPGNRQLARFYL